MEFIPIERCVDRHVYELRGRNLERGVFDAERKCFVGIRQKFDQVFLDVEYYPEAGNIRGIARPVAEIGMIQDGVSLEPGHSSDGFYHENAELLAALREFT